MKQSKIIRQAEFDRLFNIAADAKEWELCKIYALLYYGGFRISEVLQFSPAQISEAIKTKVITAYIPKQDITREIPLSPSGQALLSALLPRSADMFCFIRKINVDYLTNKINAHIKSVLGEGYTSHGFRRGLVTDLLYGDSSDAAVKEVAGIMGYRSTKTVAIYIEVMPEQKRIRMERVR